MHWQAPHLQIGENYKNYIALSAAYILLYVQKAQPFCLKTAADYMEESNFPSLPLSLSPAEE